MGNPVGLFCRKGGPSRRGAWCNATCALHQRTLVVLRIFADACGPWAARWRRLRLVPRRRVWRRLVRWECLSGCVRPERGLAGWRDKCAVRRVAETITGRRLPGCGCNLGARTGEHGHRWEDSLCGELGGLGMRLFPLTEIGTRGRDLSTRAGRGWGLVMGDRVYASPPGVSHVVERGGDVVVRLNRGALPLYERNGTRIDLLPRLRQLKGKTPREYAAWVKKRMGTGLQAG